VRRPGGSGELLRSPDGRQLNRSELEREIAGLDQQLSFIPDMQSAKREQLAARRDFLQGQLDALTIVERQIADNLDRQKRVRGQIRALEASLNRPETVQLV